MSWVRGIAWATIVGPVIAACGSGQVSLPSPAPQLVATPDEGFRREAPRAGPSQAFPEPEIHRYRLDNGLTLILMRRIDSQAAALRYVTRRGGEAGPPELAGRAWMVGNILQQSAGERRDEEAIALADLALSATVIVDFDYASLSLRLTRDRLTEAVALAAKTVREPNFAKNRVDDARRAALDKLHSHGRAPERAALLRAKGMLYGYDHRGALPLWGTGKTLRNVSRAELMALHHIAWGPRESALVVVGDLEPHRFRELAERSFGSWETERPPPHVTSPWIALDSPLVARALGLESRAPRSQVMLIDQAPSKRSPDYVPYKLLATILGGMYSSRLNGALRRESGLRSSVQASYDARFAGGELGLITQVGRRGRDISLALDAFIEELQRLMEDGLTEEELAAARALARQRMIASLETSDSAASVLSEYFALGLDASHLVRIDGELEMATPETIRDTAQRWFRPERAPIVVTGDSNKSALHSI